MYKKRYSRLILLSILCVVVLVMGGVFFTQQKEEKRVYNAVNNCSSVQATLRKQDKVNYEDGGYYKWRFTYTVDNRYYVGATVNSYKSFKEDDKIWIKYLPDENGLPVLVYEKDEEGNDKAQKTRIGAMDYYLTADSREIEYFINNPNPPSMTLTVFVFILGGCLLAAAAYQLFFILLYKSVERTGYLTYGVFEEAYTSKFGSARSMSIKYRYKTVGDEWVDAKTPHCFTVFDVEKLKGVEAFRVKYKGRTAIISENLRNL